MGAFIGVSMWVNAGNDGSALLGCMMHPLPPVSKSSAYKVSKASNNVIKHLVTICNVIYALNGCVKRYNTRKIRIKISAAFGRDTDIIETEVVSPGAVFTAAPAQKF